MMACRKALCQGWRTNGTRHNYLGTSPMKSKKWRVDPKSFATPCLNPYENAIPLREISEIESDCGELPCSNLDSDKDIRLSESDCEESAKIADIIDNIPVNLDLYVSRNGTKWIPHNCNVLG
ncbi:hypothetical protein TNCV_1045441 [Trichonephila clavipes]|nr:hypothetical protein TNCV_1045441 [Trichonephila clavipes]